MLFIIQTHNWQIAVFFLTLQSHNSQMVSMAATGMDSVARLILQSFQKEETERQTGSNTVQLLPGLLRFL